MFKALKHSIRHYSITPIPIYIREDTIILALEAIRTTRARGGKLSIARAATTYGVTKSTLHDGMNHRPRRERTQPKQQFPLWLVGVEDMANLLLRARNSEPFTLLRNIMAKYSIREGDIYNFNRTSFIIGVITASIVVIYANRYGKAKSVQPSNRK
ncbi:transposase [Colletotrichum sojae]|uniref:Transposase n=1 Tax=Colletotrichum sojae TaxID=2175907 RepID=A0A8H6MG01_9PEZI|nr:transposase [Colletotrichum sojae]